MITKTQGGNITSHTWDFNNLLTQVAASGNSYQYKYDGLMNRIAKIVNGAETRYIVDPKGSLSKVLAETTSTGNITVYYVYGRGLISKINPSGQAYYYHYDGIGSTIAITDANGNMVNKYACDAFGKILSQTETILNPFKYVGGFGVIDDGNGLLYMRARYYDPEVGRFIKKDPIGFRGGMNFYIYAKNNSIILSDPSGRLSYPVKDWPGGIPPWAWRPWYTHPDDPISYPPIHLPEPEWRKPIPPPWWDWPLWPNVGGLIEAICEFGASGEI